MLNGQQPRVATLVMVSAWAFKEGPFSLSLIPITRSGHPSHNSNQKRVLFATSLILRWIGQNQALSSSTEMASVLQMSRNHTSPSDVIHMLQGSGKNSLLATTTSFASMVWVWLSPGRIHCFTSCAVATLLEALTIPDLAKRMGVNPDTLSATVDRFNQYARDGKDLDFHRGESIYDQGYGDHAVKPNPSLAPIIKPPFYALPMYPGNIGSIFGLESNADAQLLDENGNVVPGLYAVGADQNSVMRGRYPGGGCCIGPGMVFGYRAGMHLSKATTTAR